VVGDRQQLTSWSKQRESAFYKPSEVTASAEHLASPSCGEARRIENHYVETVAHRSLEPTQNVSLQEFVGLWLEVIAGEVVTGPLERVSRQIDAGHATGSAHGRRNTEGA
jgi:hypothetical protein